MKHQCGLCGKRTDCRKNCIPHLAVNVIWSPKLVKIFEKEIILIIARRGEKV